MTPADFDQRRAWLDELLRLPHLWPWQVVQVQALAEELGVQVVIWDKALSWNGGEWKRRGE
jgi:hypothetical protein